MIGTNKSKYSRIFGGIFGLLLVLAQPAGALELVIGEERIEPGIVIIFEGAIKDSIMPHDRHLAENKTHVHLEARVNWDTRDIPESAVAGGFVPYIDIVAEVENEKTGIVTFVDLLPHLNLIDNFHYARNIALPGASTDPYKVKFKVLPPTGRTLGLHRDWVKNHGDALFSKAHEFTYTKVDFDAISRAIR